MLEIKFTLYVDSHESKRLDIYTASYGFCAMLILEGIRCIPNRGFVFDKKKKFE